VNGNPSESAFTKEVNGRVVVKLANGRVFDRHVDSIVFWRDRGQLIEVYFMLEAQTAEDAYSTALSLAKAWDLNSAPLEGWYKRASSEPPFGGGESKRTATRRNDRPQTISLEIMYSYRQDKPYRIVFAPGWRD